MRKVIVYSSLLVVGLALSQVLPALLGPAHDLLANAVRVLTMIGLAFIMIHVGFEFHLDKSNLKSYGWDYFIAFTAATFPWIFVTGYFVFVMLPPETWSNGQAWIETLLAGRFAAPTSAGVLFSMLVAAGLGATWLFRKARILAIFDDLDTVLLMVPLKMLMVGIAWQLGVIVVIMGVLLMVAYLFLHRIRMPVTWNWVLLYSIAIVGFSEFLYAGSKIIDPSVPIHIEVLLPAFVLGCLARPLSPPAAGTGRDVENQLHGVLSRPNEQLAATIVSAGFMVLVGLSMPAILGGTDLQHPDPQPASLHAAAPASAVDSADSKLATASVTGGQPAMGWGLIVFHVLMITLLSNLGKMFPAFCYRREAHWRTRLALSIGMWPRGEVGAGVLVLSLSYGIGGPIVTVAMLSLALNLVLTGVFITFVKRLISNTPDLVTTQPVASA